MAKNFTPASKISVIVPVYNEIDVISKFHTEISSRLRKQKSPFEIIYIDDHSTDGTYECLLEKANDKGLTTNDQSINVYRKEGKKGKSFSLIEGFERASGEMLIMIDADLQYPPQAISTMLKKLKSADIVVADRKYRSVSPLREVLSKAFRFIVGRMIFGLSCDIQSGLKIFKKEVFSSVRFTPSSAWTFDLEFLYRAAFAGYRIAHVPVNFTPRPAGCSKLNLSKSVLELGIHALKLKFKYIPPLIIPPENPSTMRGAGYRYNRRQFITHTTLAPSKSAIRVFTSSQLFLGIVILTTTVGLFFIFPLAIAQTLAAILSILYFLDSLYNLFLVINSFKLDAQLSSLSRLPKRAPDTELPVYTILCPLYREANIIPQFLKSIARLNWPSAKLDVLLLLEEDDITTIKKLNSLKLPSYVRKIIIPASQPLTKPKACNYGLSHARGEYLVIYDAEDIPDPLQLRKAYSAFLNLPDSVRCVQAKLNFYNPHQNLLTRFFTAEYSLWFDLTLTGLQSINSIIPLGGTSNHFRTKDLIGLQGWDPFNVTEDADLGVRLFKKGYQTAIIDSTTLEEANSNLSNWLRQRSRWIKGYMQTWLVHTRSTPEFIRSNGLKKTLLFHLTVGGKILFLLLNPFMWITLLLYFTFYAEFGPVIEIIFRPPMLYIAVTSWLFGNFFFLYSYMIACVKRGQWSIVKYVYLIPVYWVMMSYAALIALIQLIIKPHYWEKTVHGLHLNKAIAPTVFAPVNKKPRFNFSDLFHIFRLYKLKIDQSQETEAVKGGRSVYPRPHKNRGLQLRWKSLLIFYCAAFFGLDILVMHLFAPSPTAAAYIYLSVTGKLVYLAGQLTGLSVLRILNKPHKQLKEKSKIILLVFSTFLVSWVGVVLIGFRTDRFLSSFLLSKLGTFDFALPAFLIATLCFTLANTLVIYNLRKNILSLYLISCLALAAQIISMIVLRENFARLIQITLFLAGSSALIIFFLQFNKSYLAVLENNLSGLFGLFYHPPLRKLWEDNSMRILIFNWRDTRHKYAGGAEGYLHELAMRWVAEGNKVTLFCGNDQDKPSNEEIDGVEIVRRGGTYTVYLFAFIYYLLKFRGKYDLIIDCENGIPFFTPLFVRKPVILIIYHVHQEIIQKYVKFPLNHLVSLLEAKLMPVVYKNKKVVTISPSSKKDIIKLGFTQEHNIDIVYCGTSINTGQLAPKTLHPSFIYLGRLQDYKNIDVAIMAFSKLVQEVPAARLKIAGYGESISSLKKLAFLLGVSSRIDFLGKVSDSEKEKLLSESWAAIQPSQIEGWGITVIEANACGTPVIASKVNGLRDSVVDNKTGILVENRDVFGFAAAMQRIAVDIDLRENLTREALLWAKNFSWDKSAGHFYTLIGKSLPATSPRSDPAYIRSEE